MLPPPAEKLQNFFGVFLQFQIGVDKFGGVRIYHSMKKPRPLRFGASLSVNSIDRVQVFTV